MAEITKSLSETATLCRLVPFLKVEATKNTEIKRSSYLLYLYSITSRDLSPATVPSWTNLTVIVKSMSWIQKFRLHVAVRHIDRYKDAPSLTLPRQTSQLKPMHSHSSRSLPWFPMCRVSRNEGSPRRTMTSALIPCGRILLEVWNTQRLGVYIPLHLNHRTIAAFVSECPKRTKSIFSKKNVPHECPKRICTSTE